MSAEFKISKLRYSWAGNWAPNIVFIQDSVVEYQGQAFACLVGNTSSSNFYTDLYATPNPYWIQITSGKSWAGTWTTGTVYSLNNLVTYNGSIYICTSPNTSSVFLTDFNNGDWAIYLSNETWAGPWLPNTIYSPGQLATYGGITYKCQVAHTSATTSALGLEANQSAWQVYFNGVQYLGAWQQNYRYKLNDLVKLDANIYIATNSAGFNSGLTFNTSNWALYLPGEGTDLIWSVSINYQIGDAVVYGGTAYVSRSANNTGNIPSVDSTDWSQFNIGFRIKGNWFPGTTYLTGDVVNRNGRLYEATANNTTDPSTGDVSAIYSAAGSSGTTLVLVSALQLVPGMIVNGVGFSIGQTVSSISNSTTVILDMGPDGTPVDGQTLNFIGVSTSWSLLIPGKQWKSFWNSSTSYVVGDLAIRTNTTYRCIQNNSNIDPAVDTTHTYWAVYITHDLNNAMNTKGDLETFVAANGPQYTRIPIGTTSYDLAVNVNVPNWKKLNVIPVTYYVDTFLGVDDASHGTSWDTPWKTIKYSCNYVAKGLYFSNAAALLQANKAWMITEMYQWMLYQCNNNIAPFSTASLFDPFYTQRDAGYVIDAIVYDMQRGGNSQIVAATLRWFYYGSSTQLVNNIVESSIAYFAPSLTYLESLMIAAVNQVAPPASYQTLNGITGTNVINQNFNQSLTAENGVNLEITTLMNIPLTALTNLNTYLVPASNTGLTAILYIKTGTYSEILPIVVPENLSIVGDELRGVAVQPATSYQFYATQTAAGSNTITVTTTVGLTDQMPIQFISPYVNNANTSFEVNITPGQTYYILGSSITSTGFQILNAPTQVIIGTSVLGSTTLSNVSNISNLKVGLTITGPGIPANTIITAFSQVISSISTVTISSPATASGILQSFSVSGTAVTLAGGTGNMLCYAGDCLKDMWYMTNGTTMRNLSNFGLLGMLSAKDQFGISRPTGGKYTSLNPGTGPDDSTVWIIRRSPYMQNVTNFGTGCVGTKVDGTLHNGGNKSMLHNDYTQVLSDGIGVYITGPGALSECVSVFSYYNYIGHFAENGGRIRSTNGNSSYGTFGVLSWGYDTTEIPGTGTIFNQSQQVQASVSDAFGTANQLIKLNYINAGSNYFLPATNMIAQSNSFVTSPWSNDGNVSFIKNEIAPTGFTEAWLITGATNTAGTGYIQQTVGINPTGYYYSALSPSTITGAGNGATINITITPSGYIAAVASGGQLYQVGNNLLISGTTLGGQAGTNDCSLVVATVTMPVWTSNGSATSGTYYYYYNPVAGTSNYYLATSTGTFGITPPTLAQNVTSGNVTLQYIGTYSTTSSTNILVGTLVTVTSSGIVPTGTSQNYTFSLYVYPGTSQTIDIQAIFSGSSTVISGVSYNTGTNTVTPYAGTNTSNSTNAGTLPLYYGAEKTLAAGWYRVWFAVNDKTGLNTSLTYKFFAQGANAPISNTYSVIYGSQIEISGSTPAPDFYLETTNGMYTAYANYEVTGAGYNANLSGDEIRSGSIFNTRIITDSNGYTGGSGYVTNSGNAQSGNATSIQLSASDPGVYNYVNMRVLIQAGTGAGQYGWIAYYNKSTTKDANNVPGRTALVLKESVDTINVVQTTYSSTPSANLLFLANGTDISRLYVNQQVRFVPTYFNTTITQTSVATVVAVATVGGITNTIQVNSAAQLFINMPVVFTLLTGAGFNLTPGFVYYIINITGNNIQIATGISGNAVQLTNVLSTAGNTMTVTFPSYSGYLIASTTNMIPNIPIEFTGVSVGGITLGQYYYVNDIIDSNNFTVSTNLVTITVTGSIGGATNTIQTTSTTSLVPMTPIIFTGTTFDASITTNTVYYISNIPDTTDFQIVSSAGIIRTTATSTQITTNLIQISTSVNNFVLGQPIIFSGLTSGGFFGGLQRETVYYILTTNTATNQITVSSDGVNPVSLVNASGLIYVRTCVSPYVLGGGSGTMTATTTGTKVVVTNNIGQTGSMTGTYSLPLLGGVNSYTTYYITAITPGTTPSLLVSTSLAGTPITLISGTGTMQMGACGWDNFNPGTPTAIALDSQSVYYVEPRLQYSLPSWSQVTGTMAIPLTGGPTWQGIAYGNNYFLAIPSAGSTGAQSSDGNTWSSYTLPSTVAAWTSIAFGNFYWIAIGSTAGGTSVAAYSNAAGASWHTTNLPANYPGSWNKIAYGNGRFVTIATQVTQASTIAQLAPATVNWTAIAYGNGIYVAISGSGTTGWSTNGTTWNTGPSLSASYTWLDITYGANTFVAVSQAASGASISVYTTNGTTWINGGGMGVTKGLFNAVTNNGQGTWVSAASNTALVSVSTNNGLSWTTYALPATTAWTDIEFGNGIYVTLSSGQVPLTLSATSFTVSGGTATLGFATQTIAPFAPGSTITLSGFSPTSTSGTVNTVNTTFTVITCAVAGLTFALTGTYTVSVLGSVTGTSQLGSNVAAYSLGYGAQTWVATTLPLTTIWTNVAFGNGVFVALAQNGNTAYSLDGVRWISASSTVLTGASVLNWQNIRYGYGHFLAQNPGASPSQSAATSIDGINWQPLSMPSTQQWVDAAYNTALSNWVAISGNSVTSNAWAVVTITGPAAYSTNFGYSWNLSTTGLLTNKVWVGLVYGDQQFLAIASDGTIARSPDGNTWVAGQLPQASTIFTTVTINNSAGGITISASPIQLLPGMAVVVSGENTGAGTITNGTYYIYSTVDGATQMTLSSTYPTFTQITTVAGTTSGVNFAIAGVPNYTGIAWGNSRFVAIQSGTGLYPAYSFDGATWYQGLTYLSANSITYGQGVFVAVQSSGTSEYSSDSGVYWYQRTLSYGSIGVLGFGFTANNVGVFPTLSGTGTGTGSVTTISEGIRPQGRTTVTSNVISRITQWETGSNYPSAVTGTLTLNSTTITHITNISTLYAGLTVAGTGIPINSTILSVNTGASSIVISQAATASGTLVTITPSPTVTFYDFNAQISCSVQSRIASGVLSNPTFVNRGTGYNTTSTAVTISGNGFADTYQTGYTLICNNLQSVPVVGSNISIDGISQIYKVTSAYSVYGTVAPFIEANIQVSPSVTNANSPANGTKFTVRALYSQVRLTNHDFLSIGVGNYYSTNYPNVDESTALPQNEAIEVNQGHVFYVSTDENGNFLVGSLFGVEQATGTVTLSATQFGLIGLNTLSLGGLAVGSSSVVVTQISTDPSFTANSDAILPTQKAIKSYITSRLSQGGANTFTGNLIAGTVEVGNPNLIASSIPNGISGSVVKMSNKVYINKKGVDGNMAALDFFGRNAWNKTSTQVW